MKKIISYVSDNGQFYADTVSDYNNYDDTTNCDHFGVCSGNQNIGINVGGDTYLPTNFPIFMYEYGWVYGGQGPGNSSSYYVGILQYNSARGLRYFLTTQCTNNPSPSLKGYYDYYYSGSADGGSDYYFLEDNNSNNNIQGQDGGSNYFAFMPPDRQQNQNYSRYRVFWLYNWFQAGNGNMYIYFLMNGNIFNYPLASSSSSYSVDGQSIDVIPPNPPANTINGEPIFAQSYINAYNTAFNQETENFNENYQAALYKYTPFTPGDVNNNFVPGTFGYDEQYNNLQSDTYFTIYPLQDDANYYDGTPCLFISAGSGGGAGVMYLDWIIVTYGVPYVASVS